MTTNESADVLANANSTDYPSKLAEFLKESSLHSDSTHLFEYQQYVYDYMTKANKRGILLFHSVGSGKCMAFNTPVMMYDGTIRKIQDVEVGDLLMGDDSTSRSVLSLARGVDTMYNIWYEGRKYSVNKDHILCLKRYDPVLQRVCDAVHCMSVTDFVNLSREDQRNFRGYRNTITFKYKDVGDTYQLARAVAVSIYSDNINASTLSPLFVNSPDVQLESIAGVLDMLGHSISYKGNDAIELYMSSNIKPLMDYLLFACNTRGILNRCRKVRDAYKITIYGSYIMSIPFRVISITNPSDEDYKHGYCIRVKPYRIDNYYGFTLSGNRRYALADCTITHNTMTSVSIAEHFRRMGSKVIVLSSKSLQLNYKKEILAYRKIVDKGDSTGVDIENTDAVEGYEFITSNARNMIRKLRGGITQNANTAVEPMVESDNGTSEEEVADTQSHIQDTQFGSTSTSPEGEARDDTLADTLEELSGYTSEDTQDGTYDDTQAEQDADTPGESSGISQAGPPSDTPGESDENTSVVQINNSLVERVSKSSDESDKDILVKPDNDTQDRPSGEEPKTDQYTDPRDDNAARLENVLKFLTNQSLEDKVIVIDEAHNLFNSISNGSAIANEFYDMVMDTKRCKLIFLTGTPIINDPFEIAICFNMLVGKLHTDQVVSNAKRQKQYTTILPEHYVDFVKYFIDKANNRIGNYDKFRNRIFGLTSYYGDMYTRPVERVETELYKTISKDNYPDRLPVKFEICQMSIKQHGSYMEAREKERKENWRKSTSGGDPRPIDKVGGAVVVETSGSSTSYRIRSRQLSNVYIPEHTDKDQSTKDIMDVSPKMVRILKNIEENPNKIHLVYSTFLKYGIGYFADILKSKGWRKFGDGDHKPGKTYAIFSGEQTMEEKQDILQACRSSANAHGETISVLMISKSGTEGLDLKNVRCVHIMEPYWNFSLIQQVIARGVRYKSHEDLPTDERSVQTYVYLSDYNPLALKELKERQALRKKKEPLEETTDVHMFKNAVKNQDLVQTFLQCIASASIECPLLNKDMLKCFGCASTGKPLYYNDITLDLQTSNNCVATSKVTADEFIIDGEKYWYSTDPKTGVIRVFTPRVSAITRGKPMVVELFGDTRDNVVKHIQSHLETK